ncbi:ribonuclease HII [Robiginitalea sp.]|jgi:ribonuclease HII|uniref:ribonuclease HII n=1 Tax=Robiginitalea sp. TaxID=1902411 RepID=UPI003C71128A
MLKLSHTGLVEAGTDEAGRGCLAGPVTAAAVILPDGFTHPFLTDSKKLSALKREKLAAMIRETAVAYGIAHVPPEIIDDINILNASIMAMHQALDKLHIQPEAIAVDGNRFKPYKAIPHECLIRGDGRFLNIAAASILAKTSRDSLMRELHEVYPEYQWTKNKGYPTHAHRHALLKYGPSPYHRKSFRLKEEQLKFNY